ncbi:uncharacterized protein [Procambarus clarkii]|uniref:uncharacterized protein n=1 Tax=Procambarus clarkii TaxID=6728 RepID=UPI0037431436
MGQGVESSPNIGISDYKLEVVHDFVYLGSTISDSLSLDSAFNKCLGKASTTMSRLTNESWTLRARQERKLNAYHMRCLRHILDITWQDKVTNNSVLGRARILSMYLRLKLRRMRWLGHVVRMGDDRIPKDLLYGEMTQ